MKNRRFIPGEESDTEMETYELEPPRIENWRCQVYDRGMTFEDLGFWKMSVLWIGERNSTEVRKKTE